MREKINNYIKQFIDLYNGEPWLDISFSSTLSKLEEEKAFKKPLKNTHSVAEIVSHIIAYRNFLLVQFMEEKDFDVNQEKSFETEIYASKSKSLWTFILDAFDDNQKKLIEHLEKSDDSILSKKVHHRNYELRYLMDGILQHDAYHLGQVVILLKASDSE